MLKPRAILFLSILLSGVSLPAWATSNYALIVGVSKYQNLPESMHLAGPRNDAEMLSKFLRQTRIRPFPAKNITVLADGVENAQLPTRKAILDAMDSLAAKAARDDFVYLHFSGHGSRQPAKKGDLTETDGLDELFLPSDIGKWNDAVGTVENALVDDEIGARVDAIRAKGAFVWAVFDSCHSGTVTRGAPVGEDVRMRKVESLTLGIPDALIDRAIADAPKTRGQPPNKTALKLSPTKDGMGGLVAFYAAQSTEQTPEMRLPAGEDVRVAHGLFSFTLMQVVSEHPGITYRRAAQDILQRYAANYMDRPTPLFEGDLDARVFGSSSVDEKPQWPIAIVGGAAHIPAGSLNRLSSGSIVAILPSPAAADSEALGYAKISAPQALDSQLTPTAYKTKKPLELASIPKGAFARVVEQKLHFGIRVARPAAVAGQPQAVKRRIDAVLAKLKPDDDTGLRIEWVTPGAAADVRLAYYITETGKDGKVKTLDQDQLWMLPPTGAVVLQGGLKTPSIRLGDKDDKGLQFALLDNLGRIARVLNLLRISEGMGAGSGRMKVNLKVKRKADGKLYDIPIERVPEMYPGDEVHLRATNAGDKPVDVNVLFIGSDYAISHGFKGRIHPNDTLNKGLFRVNQDSLGTERLLVIATEAKPESIVQDFSFLAQRALPKTRATTADSGLGALLKDAVFGSVKTRGVEPLGDADEGPSSILQFGFETKLQP